HVSALVFGVKVFSILQVLIVDQTSVIFVHRASVVSVLAPMETMLHLECRHCSLPPVQTVAPYLLCRLLFLPREQTAAPYLLCRLLLLTS
ncbi:hypothetical protein Tco_0983623, partial [Tanacetum coccineum]